MSRILFWNRDPDRNAHRDSKKGYFGSSLILPLLLNACNQKKISLAKIVELTCENPAKIFGLNNKGYIKNGFDADLVVIDLKLRKEINYKNLKTKCGWSPYENWSLKGYPILILVGGNVLM